MDGFRFDNMAWIHGIWAVLLIGGLLVALELRGRSVLDLLVSKLMQRRLVHRSSLARRLTAMALILLSMIMLIIALMRPQWGRTVQETVRVDSQIMVCLDVSKSMLAEDVAPNRLERAKVELASLLGLMQDNQQVGLIAFAGKAAVLCPVTTDFGFLRLVLDEAEPRSVGRGGTKIGTALRKALDGFREAGDINRTVLLITDGEDHDSYPLKVAKRAREMGVRIVAIGFGDEAGSKIEITDPETGARSYLKDSQGEDVITRLDGETLRDIVRKTEGAYVPAKTGALDLESIYEKHIKTILAGSANSEQRVIRNEAYQWFVLGGILLLLISLATSTPWNLRVQALTRSQHAGGEVSQAVGVAMALLLVSLAPRAIAASRPSRAQQSQPAAAGPLRSENHGAPNAPNAKQGMEPAGDPADNSVDSLDKSLPARTTYNQSLAFIDSDTDRAERYLNHARHESGADGELRFRVLYNLGWVEVNRAEAKLENEPERALQHLHQAANRFREAIRVRPDHQKARQNLEIISRRILELTDALRQRDPRDLATRLDTLITRTRAHQKELQAMVQSIAEDSETSVESHRKEFRRLAVAERKLISATQQFLDDARTQLDAIRKKNAEEKTRRDKLLAVQLDGMVGFVDRGIQRMNKSRGLSRRLQAEAAFRRWSSALAELKRARDQLRNPVAVLGQIIADATQAAGFTRMLASGQLAIDTGQPEESDVQVPVWLTADYVADLLALSLDRTREVRDEFRRIADLQKESEARTAPAGKPAGKRRTLKQTAPKTEHLIKNMEAATPLIRRAQEKFEAAASELDNNAVGRSHQHQLEALAELRQAQELFFDIRRLIESIHRHQQLAQRVIKQSVDQPHQMPQIVEPLAETQRKNLKRCERLRELFQLENEQLAAKNVARAAGSAATQTPPSAGQSPGQVPGDEQGRQTDQLEAEKQRLKVAHNLLDSVVSNIRTARQVLQSDAMSEYADAPADALSRNESKASRKEKQTVETSGSEERADGGNKPAGEPEEKGNAKRVKKKVSSEEVDAETGGAELEEQHSKGDERANQSGRQSKPQKKPQEQSSSAESDSNRPKASGPLAKVGTAVDDSVTALEELRRLFFSLIEHLRDTARRQADVNDETAELQTADQAADRPEQTGSLAIRQQQLGEIAQRISAALTRQGEQAAAAADRRAAKKQSSQPPPSRDTAATAETFSQAAELVGAARESMKNAGNQLMAISREKSSQKTPLKKTQQNQSQALEKLAQALKLLKQKQQQQQQQQPRNKPPSTKKKPQQGGQKKQRKQKQQRMNTSQLLQLIRDREAERRESKKRRAPAGSVPVDKDW